MSQEKSDDEPTSNGDTFYRMEFFTKKLINNAAFFLVNSKIKNDGRIPKGEARKIICNLNKRSIVSIANSLVQCVKGWKGDTTNFTADSRLPLLSTATILNDNTSIVTTISTIKNDNLFTDDKIGSFSFK